jgi:hypothetical protein
MTGAGGAALGLAEQSLFAVQVDEAGVPPVGPQPLAHDRVEGPAGLAAAGLVDPEHRRRLGLDEHRVGVLVHARLHGRPAQPVLGGDLGHAAVVGHRVRRRGPKPTRRSAPGWDLRDRLGECPSWTIGLLAAPTTLVPKQLHCINAVRDVPWPGGHLLLARGRHHPASRAQPSVLAGCDNMNHASAILATLDTRDCHTGQPQQQRRTLLQGPFLLIMLRQIQR